ncbi:MAG: Uma2 family endonuclease [Caldilineaceae bacterium]
MATTVLEATTEVESLIHVETSHLITEDDEPVDNIFSEKQQRLLTEPLYTSWKGPGDDRPFLATANVGVFMVNQNPAIVPDVLLSLDVVMPEDWWSMEGRSYAVWQLGKTPDCVIEIVSNKKGDELDGKLKKYEQLRVPIYVVFDPDLQIQDELVAIYLLNGFGYRKADTMLFPEIGLGLLLWEGEFEGRTTKWLRWIDLDGNLIATGDEQRVRAEQEAARAEQEKSRADRLAAQLRAAGIEPEL